MTKEISQNFPDSEEWHKTFDRHQIPAKDPIIYPYGRVRLFLKRITNFHYSDYQKWRQEVLSRKLP